MATLAYIIDATELIDFGGKCQQGSNVCRKELEVALNNSGNHVLRRAIPAAPIDRGRLRGSITNVVTYPQAQIGSNLIHAKVMEDGRRAGAAPPPTEAIRGWLSRKGGDPNAAYVVARSIGRRGITGKKFLANALAASMGDIHREFDMAFERIMRSVTS